jgi:arsenite methyltransferase
MDIEPTRIYSVAQSKEILAEVGLDSEELAAQVDNKFMSAFVRARKPGLTEP